MDVACTALFNMERIFDKRGFALGSELVPFVEQHWADLSAQRERSLHWASALENSLKAHPETFAQLGDDWALLEGAMRPFQTHLRDDDDDRERTPSPRRTHEHSLAAPPLSLSLPVPPSASASASPSASPVPVSAQSSPVSSASLSPASRLLKYKKQQAGVKSLRATGEWCHQCKQKHTRVLCCTGACTKKYCHRCLERHYGLHVDALDALAWRCPFCERRCSCALCRMPDALALADAAPLPEPSARRALHKELSAVHVDTHATASTPPHHDEEANTKRQAPSPHVSPVKREDTRKVPSPKRKRSREVDETRGRKRQRVQATPKSRPSESSRFDLLVSDAALEVKAEERTREKTLAPQPTMRLRKRKAEALGEGEGDEAEEPEEPAAEEHVDDEHDDARFQLSQRRAARATKKARRLSKGAEEHVQSTPTPAPTTTPADDSHGTVWLACSAGGVRAYRVGASLESSTWTTAASSAALRDFSRRLTFTLRLPTALAELGRVGEADARDEEQAEAAAAPKAAAHVDGDSTAATAEADASSLAPVPAPSPPRMRVSPLRARGSPSPIRSGVSMRNELSPSLGGASRSRATVSDLLRAGVLRVGDRIAYKDHLMYEAELRADGQLQYDAQLFNALSSFAKFVAVKAEGAKSTAIFNGWATLRCRGRTLDELRAQYETQRGRVDETASALEASGTQGSLGEAVAEEAPLLLGEEEGALKGPLFEVSAEWTHNDHAFWNVAPTTSRELEPDEDALLHATWY